MWPRIMRVALVLAGATALGACSTYDGYSRSHVSVGYGNAYASPYYGWYDNYYYPGTGYYIYDRRGARHRWNDAQRRYWQARRASRHARDNWSGYNVERRHYRGDRQRYREHRRDYREQRRRYREDRRGYREDRSRYRHERRRGDRDGRSDRRPRGG